MTDTITVPDGVEQLPSGPFLTRLPEPPAGWQRADGAHYLNSGIILSNGGWYQVEPAPAEDLTGPAAALGRPIRAEYRERVIDEIHQTHGTGDLANRGNCKLLVDTVCRELEHDEPDRAMTLLRRHLKLRPTPDDAPAMANCDETAVYKIMATLLVGADMTAEPYRRHADHHGTTA